MKDVRVMGRSTQGVRLVNVHEGDHLVGLQRIENLESTSETLVVPVVEAVEIIETPVEPPKETE